MGGPSGSRQPTANSRGSLYVYVNVHVYVYGPSGSRQPTANSLGSLYVYVNVHVYM